MKREILEVVVRNRLRTGKYCIVSLVEGVPLVLATPDMQTEDWTRAMKAIADHLGITALQFTERALEKHIEKSKEPILPVEEVSTVARNNSNDISGNPMKGSCSPSKAAGSKGKPSAKAKSSPKPTSKLPAKQH